MSETEPTTTPDDVRAMTPGEQYAFYTDTADLEPLLENPNLPDSTRVALEARIDKIKSAQTLSDLVPSKF